MVAEFKPYENKYPIKGFEYLDSIPINFNMPKKNIGVDGKSVWGNFALLAV